MAPERTALYDQHLALGGRMVDFAGWLLPQQYTSIRAEHLAVRQSAGLFDLSHMGRLGVFGNGAFDFLQRLITNDLSRIDPGHAQYSLLCNDAAGILDDLIVYREAPERFAVVVNASTREKDIAWMRQNQPATVTLEDVTREVSLLALQGPNAEHTLQPHTDINLAQLPYFGLAFGKIVGVPGCMVSRTGYTGEDGFEIFVESADVGRVWGRILDAAPSDTVLPCGLGARDVCRLEAGYRLYGSDMDENTDPYTAGLGWTVKLQKGDFIGRDALLRVKEMGASKTSLGIRCDARAIPRHGMRLIKELEDIGEVTSGTYSFFLNAGIGMVRVERDNAQIGGRIELKSRAAEASGELVELPFYRGSVKLPATAKAK